MRSGPVPLLFLLLIAVLAAPLRGEEPASIEAIQQSIESGNLTAASRQLSVALSARPNDAGLLNLRGVVHAQRNELTEARKDFERAVALAPALSPAWRNLGRSCQMAIGADSAASGCAARAWKHVLAVEPGDPEARFSLAAVYELEGKYDASLAEIRKLPAGETGRAPTLALECADLAGLGRIQDAIGVAQRLSSAAGLSAADVVSILPAVATPKGAPVAVALIEGLDGRGLASPTILRQLVTAYEQSGRLGDARKTLERLAAGDPANPQHLLELARAAYLEHDLEGSLGYLGHARDLTPADAQVHFLFGMVLDEMKLPFEARKSVEKAVALAPDNPDYKYALGTIFITTGDYPRAIQQFKLYVNARPRDTRGHFALGVAYFGATELENCQAEMRGIREDPNTAGGAAYFLGRVARINQNFDEAATDLERATRLMPSFADAYTELARVRLDQGRLEDAKAAVGRALALDPDSFQANSTLLSLYGRTRDPRLREQSARLKKLDEERNKKQDELQRLMLRGIEVKPY